MGRVLSCLEKGKFFMHFSCEVAVIICGQKAHCVLSLTFMVICYIEIDNQNVESAEGKEEGIFGGLRKEQNI